MGGGEIFRTCPDRPWGPPSLLYNEYQVFSGGKERPGGDADPSPPSSAVVKKVELYLYSPYRPYGLYRASVPVQGCTYVFYLLQHRNFKPLFINQDSARYRGINKYNFRKTQKIFKFTSKYRGNFWPATVNTGVISVYNQLSF